MDDLFGLADEIEAEIARNYMLLPKDADGVPIRVGDVMLTSIGQPVKVGAVCGDGFAVDDVPLWYGRDCTHHHPPTVEDVLCEFANDVLNANKQLISEQGTEAYVLSAANECAERLREVLRDE